MGIEPFLISSAVRLIQAQRLVRRICKDCKKETSVPVQVLIAAGFSGEEAETIQVFKGEGCSRCNGSGYRGRIGLFEAMEMTSSLQELILDDPSAEDLRRHAIANGMITLRRSGLEKIKQGLTTIEEVLKETVK
jgi:type IV pilus assembly protein PilB